MLSDLDQSAVEELNHATTHAVTEEEINRLLEEHFKNRDKLRNDMLAQKKVLEEKLAQKLLDRNKFDIQASENTTEMVDTEDTADNVDVTESHDDVPQSQKKPKPAIPSSLDLNVGSHSREQWKPGLPGVMEGDEFVTSRGVRSNTFTKNDEEDKDNTVNSDNQDSSKYNLIVLNDS